MNTAAYAPQLDKREQFAGKISEVACLFIDLQNYALHEEGTLFKQLPEEAKDERRKMLKACSPKWEQLLQVCRARGIEVVYTVIQSLTKDGRDLSRDYKISGFYVPPGSFDAQVLDVVSPVDDEIVIPKTSCSVFQSTHLDYLLRQMEKRFLVICGGLTDQCVSHAVRDGCDLGYQITVITDGCVASSAEDHERGLRTMSGFCRQRSMAELIAELRDLSL